MTTWRLRTTLLVPTAVLTSPEGGLPETLQFDSRVPDQVRDYGNHRVKLSSAENSPEAVMYAENPHVKPVHLITEVQGDGPGLPPQADPSRPRWKPFST
jgi:hypothetical protein